MAGRHSDGDDDHGQEPQGPSPYAIHPPAGCWLSRHPPCRRGDAGSLHSQSGRTRAHRAIRRPHLSHHIFKAQALQQLPPPVTLHKQAQMGRPRWDKNTVKSQPAARCALRGCVHLAQLLAHAQNCCVSQVHNLCKGRFHVGMWALACAHNARNLACVHTSTHPPASHPNVHWPHCLKKILVEVRACSFCFLACWPACMHS